MDSFVGVLMHSEAFQEQLIYHFNIKSKSSFDIKSRLMKTLFLPLISSVLNLIEKIVFHIDSVKLALWGHIVAQSFSVLHILQIPLAVFNNE